MKDGLDYEINHNYRKGYDEGFADGRAAAWIQVSEATPKANQKAIIFINVFGGGLIDTAEYRGGVFVGMKWHADQDRITHWMPLPAAPEQKEGGGDGSDF